ncbi:hypothetical protein BDF14DRAFT_1755939 [Spinellus fusiger]|nr:hypothetical protein BDF14DRAFT_1755939 [Spinellus fusiger]
MLSRIINTIYNQINKAPDSGAHKEKRSASFAGTSENDCGALARSMSVPSVESGINYRRPSVTEAIGIHSSNNRARRGSTALFGISTVSADDFMQKDLVSSSWS